MEEYRVRPPFPEVLDSTAMSAFRACPRRWELMYLRHWKPLQSSVDLVAGAAFAAGLEAARVAWWGQKVSIEEAHRRAHVALEQTYGGFECPPTSVKTLARMHSALDFYFKHYPMETDDKPPAVLSSGRLGVEFSFAEPLPIDHPETGQPLIYTGRLDMICRYAGGLYGEDDKTASQLGATWPGSWDLRSQFTGYAWGCRRAGLDLVGFVIRGVSILKEASPKYPNKKEYETMETITYRPEWQVERWERGMVSSVKRMIEMWQTGEFDYNLDDACNSFRGCPFKQVCQVSEPEKWLAGSFERRAWNPLTRTEEKII